MGELLLQVKFCNPFQKMRLESTLTYMLLLMDNIEPVCKWNNLYANGNHDLNQCAEQFDLEF